MLRKASHATFLKRCPFSLYSCSGQYFSKDLFLAKGPVLLRSAMDEEEQSFFFFGRTNVPKNNFPAHLRGNITSVSSFRIQDKIFGETSLPDSLWDQACLLSTGNSPDNAYNLLDTWLGRRPLGAPLPLGHHQWSCWLTHSLVCLLTSGLVQTCTPVLVLV